MALVYIRSLRSINIPKEFIQMGGCRTLAVGSKGGAAANTSKVSTISKEIKATVVVGANPKILQDSEYSEWLGRLLDKRPALSELRWKDIESLPYEDLKRFVKLDNRARIKENNSIRAKN